MLQEVFTFINVFLDCPQERRVMTRAVRDEVFLFPLETLLAGADLRAKFRGKLSITDAYEQGGAAAESSGFDLHVILGASSPAVVALASSNEEAVRGRLFRGPRTCICGQ